MKIIVFSDTHGSHTALERLFLAHRDAELFLFLGDGLDDVKRLQARYADFQVHCVRGNCDRTTEDIPYEDTVSVGGKILYFTHGHLFGVKYYDLSVLDRGKQLGASAVFYGHTHIQECTYRNGMWLCNPGSLALSKRGKLSFCIADVGEKGIYCASAEIDTASR